MSAGLSVHERTRIEMTAVDRVCCCEVDEFAADVHHGSRSDGANARFMRSFYVSVYIVEEIVGLLVRIQSNTFVLVRRDWHFSLAPVLLIPFAVTEIER